MPLQAVSVSAEIVDASGAPVPGAHLTATLSRLITDGGVAVPVQVAALTDDLGQCVLRLWPNSFGDEPSSYTFELLVPGVMRPFLFPAIVVPNVSAITFLELIDGLPAQGDPYVADGYVVAGYFDDVPVPVGLYMAADYVAPNYV
jgi:hypothetical protein